MIGYQIATIKCSGSHQKLFEIDAFKNRSITKFNPKLGAMSLTDNQWKCVIYDTIPYFVY